MLNYTQSECLCQLKCAKNQVLSMVFCVIMNEVCTKIKRFVQLTNAKIKKCENPIKYYNLSCDRTSIS